MNIHQFNVKNSAGEPVSLEKYKGQVLLVVNTATGCGFTPQYEGLEALYEKFADAPFEILDFPCNQFLDQAPGSNDELVSFCKLNYNTKFETFGKIEVNGEDADPLYVYLKEQIGEDITNSETAGFLDILAGLDQTRGGSDIKWNFTKFLIGKDGEVIKRFSPTVSPQELEAEIQNLL